MGREGVGERDSVITLGVVRTEEQRDFDGRYNLHHVVDNSGIGTAFLELSLVKLGPAVRIIIESRTGPALGAMLFGHRSTLAHSVASPRPNMVNGHPRTARSLGRAHVRA